MEWINPYGRSPGRRPPPPPPAAGGSRAPAEPPSSDRDSLHYYGLGDGGTPKLGAEPLHEIRRLIGLRGEHQQLIWQHRTSTSSDSDDEPPSGPARVERRAPAGAEQRRLHSGSGFRVPTSAGGLQTVHMPEPAAEEEGPLASAATPPASSCAEALRGDRPAGLTWNTPRRALLPRPGEYQHWEEGGYWGCPARLVSSRPTILHVIEEQRQRQHSPGEGPSEAPSERARRVRAQHQASLQIGELLQKVQLQQAEGGELPRTERQAAAVRQELHLRGGPRGLREEVVKLRLLEKHRSKGAGAEREEEEAVRKVDDRTVEQLLAELGEAIDSEPEQKAPAGGKRKGKRSGKGKGKAKAAAPAAATEPEAAGSASERSGRSEPERSASESEGEEPPEASAARLAQLAAGRRGAEQPPRPPPPQEPPQPPAPESPARQEPAERPKPRGGGGEAEAKPEPRAEPSAEARRPKARLVPLPQAAASVPAPRAPVEPQGGARGSRRDDAAVRCHYCQERGHLKADCPRRPSPKCFHCDKRGHLQADCPDRLRAPGGAGTARPADRPARAARAEEKAALGKRSSEGERPARSQQQQPQQQQQQVSGAQRPRPGRPEPLPPQEPPQRPASPGSPWDGLVAVMEEQIRQSPASQPQWAEQEPPTAQRLQPQPQPQPQPPGSALSELGGFPELPQQADAWHAAQAQAAQQQQQAQQRQAAAWAQAQQLRQQQQHAYGLSGPAGPGQHSQPHQQLPPLQHLQHPDPQQLPPPPSDWQRPRQGPPRDAAGPSQPPAWEPAPRHAGSGDRQPPTQPPRSSGAYSGSGNLPPPPDPRQRPPPGSGRAAWAGAQEPLGLHAEQAWQEPLGRSGPGSGPGAEHGWEDDAGRRQWSDAAAQGSLERGQGYGNGGHSIPASPLAALRWPPQPGCGADFQSGGGVRDLLPLLATPQEPAFDEEALDLMVEALTSPSTSHQQPQQQPQQQQQDTLLFPDCHQVTPSQAAQPAQPAPSPARPRRPGPPGSAWAKPLPSLAAQPQLQQLQAQELQAQAQEQAQAQQAQEQAQAQQQAAGELSQEEQDERDLQAALQASLQTHQEAEASRSAAAAAEAALWAGRAGGAGQAEEAGAAGTGLRNEAGEYNCFLNCILQCLWHLQALRDGVLRWSERPPERLKENSVANALVRIFCLFAEASAAAGGGESGQALRRRGVVTPAALRQALHERDAGHFRMGEMSDAAEVLATILDSVAAVAGGPRLVARCFEWRLREFVACAACNGRVSRDSSHAQLLHTLPAAALRDQAAAARARGSAAAGSSGGAPPLARLIAGAEAATLKSCDDEAGGCGRKLPVQQQLQADAKLPKYFVLQLCWAQAQEPGEVVRETLAALSEEVDVSELLRPCRKRVYRLRSMVCFYGSHYHAFVADDAGVWTIFDDARVSTVGAWPAVRARCGAGKMQPSLLFFAARDN